MSGTSTITTAPSDPTLWVTPETLPPPTQPTTTPSVTPGSQWAWNLPPSALPGSTDPGMVVPPSAANTDPHLIAPPPPAQQPGGTRWAGTPGFFPNGQPVPTYPGVQPATAPPRPIPPTNTPAGQPPGTRNVPPGSPASPSTGSPMPTRSWQDPNSPTGRGYGWPGGRQSPYYGPNDPMMGLGPRLRVAGPAGSLVVGSESGGANRYGPMTSSGQAEGYYQITTGTWSQFAPQAGVDLQQYPDPIHAPFDVQTRVANIIPMGRWTAGWQAVRQQYPWATPDMTLGQVNQFAGGNQALLPPEAREPADWGRPYRPGPGSDLPGMMPRPNEVPGIMRNNLLPLLAIASMASRAPLWMTMSAFGSFIDARNKRQILDEKINQTKWQEALKESTAKGELESQAYGEAFTSAGNDVGQLDQKLAAIAQRFGDQAMLNALGQGGARAAHDLQQYRDQHNQNLQKVNFQQQKELFEEQRQMWEDQLRFATWQASTAKSEQERQSALQKAADARQKLEDQNKQREAYGLPPVPVPPAPDAGPAPTPSVPPPPSSAPAVAGPGPASPDTEPGAAPDPSTEPAAPSTAPPAPSTAPTPPPGATPPQPAAAPPPPTAGPPPTAPSGAPPAAPGPASSPSPPSATPPQPATGQPAAQPAAPAAAPSPSGTQPIPTPPGMAPMGTPQAALIDQQARNLLNGQTNMQDIPKDVQPYVGMRVAQMQQAIDAATQGKTGGAVYDAVHAIDPDLADAANNVAHYAAKPPTVGIGGAGRQFVTMVNNLAPMITPGWNAGNFQAQAEFRNPNGRTATSLKRANSMTQAAKQVLQDLNGLPDDPTTFTRLADLWYKKHISGDPAYTKLFIDWQKFAIESNVVATGAQPSVTETEQMIQAIPPYSSKAQFRAGVQQDLGTADARINADVQNWGDIQGQGKAPNYSPEASRDIRTIIKTGQVPGSTVGGRVVGGTYTDAHGNKAMWMPVDPRNPSNPSNWQAGP